VRTANDAVSQIERGENRTETPVARRWRGSLGSAIMAT